MIEAILCKICGKRRAKRACPAVHGDICSICCGTEREVTLLCPLECEYLEDAHHREQPLAIDEQDSSNRDVEVSEDFVGEHEELLLFCIYSLLQAGLRTNGAVDTDVLAALDALIKTHKTMDSGLVYETFSANTIAAAIQRSFSTSLAEYQKLRQEREALSPVRNSEILKTLVFLHRVGQQNQNGRPRGRMYLDLLRHMTPDSGVEERSPSIIL
jgi:hypothetical protein